ncbi:phosphatase PAP2 family protein [Phocaeicola dorei]|uniref:phosphatase PAP2 family protein n=1 Tax=Phocaeicola dorei TaxID=357276 RepID=UPI003D7A8DD2
METVVHFHSPVSHTDTAGSKRIKTHHRSASPGCHKLFLFSFRTYGSSIYGSYLLYKEYGFKGYWIGLVAYAAAIVTGFTRILNNRHWLFDVIIGAALGILLTDLAFRLVQLIFKDRGLIQHK